MASVSATSLILFIASIVVAAGVAGVLIDTVSGISGALDDRGADVSDSIETDVEVISDAESGVYNASSDTLTLYVKNTGLRTIPDSTSVIDLFVDGTYQSSITMTVVDSTEWEPHAVVRLDIDVTLSSGDHRVKLVLDGDEEVFKFRT